MALRSWGENETQPTSILVKMEAIISIISKQIRARAKILTALQGRDKYAEGNTKTNKANML